MSETTLTYRSRIHATAADLARWHARPGAFARLTPPWMNVRVAAAKGTISPGDWKQLRVAIGPAHFTWQLRHEAAADGFIDVQQRGPFAFWRHEHRFLPDGDGTSILEDRLTFQVPLGAVGQALAEHRIEREMNEVFRLRHQRTANDLARHRAAGLETPQRIAITGASGLVGRHLADFLRAGGHRVFSLVRRPPRTDDEIFWAPESGEIDASALEGLDAVVHLAGVSIASGRWTASRKRAIRESRVEGTALLARTLAKLAQPPRVLVSASAVGYYGDHGSGVLTEESSPGDDFLAEVCREWEAAASPAAEAGIRVVHPRFGIVLSGSGGVLKQVMPLFRLGAGGVLGSGDQFFSWIALDDLLAVLLQSIADPRLSGPVNAVAPQEVTNREFTHTLGQILHRPTVLPASAPALRLALGEMADELLLASQRVRPARLEAAGFRFAFPTLEEALRHETGRHGGIFAPASFRPAVTREAVLA